MAEKCVGGNPPCLVAREMVADDFWPEDADHIGAALHLLVPALERIRRVQLGAVRGQERHTGEHVVFAFVHQGAELGPLRAQLV